jgi:hypothetical protein
MHRRQFLSTGGGLAAFALLTAHSPYKKFHVYRKTRLILVSSKTDRQAAVITEALAALIGTHWADSRAATTRAYDNSDLVKLISSQQLDVGLLAAEDAVLARMGTGPFAKQGAAPLAALAAIGRHLLICREDLLEPVARKIAIVLAGHWRELDAELIGTQKTPIPSTAVALPLHAAALSAYRSAGAVL